MNSPEISGGVQNALTDKAPVTWLSRLLLVFRRITSERKYIPQIDGLRALAILGVILVHTSGIWNATSERQYSPENINPQLERLFYLGRYGVELFFAISGFILAFPFVRAANGNRPPVILRDYYLRRLTRIEPPYLVSMVLFLIATIAIGKYSTDELIPHFIASIFYVHNIVYGTGSLINNVAWSLEIEVQFYVLFPLMTPIFARAKTVRLATYLLLALPCILNSHWLSVSFPETLIKYGHFFIAGIATCDFYETTALRELRSKLRIADVFLPLSFLILWLGHLVSNPTVNQLSTLFFVALIFHAALYGPISSYLLSYGIVPLIGGMCYSIYLLHARVISLSCHGFLKHLALTDNRFLDILILFAILTPLCILCSIPFYLLIERPCMRPEWHNLFVNLLRKMRGHHVTTKEGK